MTKSGSWECLTKAERAAGVRPPYSIANYTPENCWRSMYHIFDISEETAQGVSDEFHRLGRSFARLGKYADAQGLKYRPRAEAEWMRFDFVNERSAS